MILVDSIPYTNNSTNVDSPDKDSIIIDEKHEEINIKQSEENKLDKNELIVNLNEETNHDDFKEMRFRDLDNSNSLGLWAIILITLGCVTVTAFVAVCAYYIGVFRVKPKVIPVVVDIEPPIVDIIPRVRGTVEPFNYNFDR